MPALDDYLAADEDLHVVTNRHVSVLLRPLMLLLFAAVVGVALGFGARLGRGEEIADAIAAGIVALGGLNLVVAVLRWRTEEVALTDRRVLEVSGLWRRRVTSIAYSRIVSVGLARGFWSRLARSGDVLVDLDGGATVTLARIPRARAFHRALIGSVSGDAPDRSDPEGRIDTGELPRFPA